MPSSDAAGRASPRAAVVGTGLIGGSIGLGLRARGWHVSGRDVDVAAALRARELGALDEVGDDPDAGITFVATPVSAISSEVRHALDTTRGLVTDVGSVKAPMLELMSEARYVGGHPMAGSELDGIEGARPDLFEGATWVLTPIAATDDRALTEVRAAVTALGAEVVTLAPDRHDTMVALVSHVPHLTAAALMKLADERSSEHRALLRLAAGGFRDMTRVAAGQPGIWPDICAENRIAIVDELDRLIEALAEMRAVVEKNDREGLVETLERARAARVALPARFARPEELSEVRVPIPDRKGEVARITTLATDFDVSIADIEIAHSAEGPQGVLIMLVESTLAERLAAGLAEHGYKPSVHTLQ
jgi:prephenate dehydrogenase